MIVEKCIPYVLENSSTLNVLKSDIHGLDHWFRVWTNIKLLSKWNSEVDLEVAALFALFHDSMRDNDDHDPQHGLRGFKLWELVNFNHILSAKQNAVLEYACINHNDGLVTDDPTIGACWDADRLDLPRVGIEPDIQFMSTSVGCKMIMSKALPNSRENHLL